MVSWEVMAVVVAATIMGTATIIAAIIGRSKPKERDSPEEIVNTEVRMRSDSKEPWVKGVEGSTSGVVLQRTSEENGVISKPTEPFEVTFHFLYSEEDTRPLDIVQTAFESPSRTLYARFRPRDGSGFWYNTGPGKITRFFRSSGTPRTDGLILAGFTVECSTITRIPSPPWDAA